MRELPENTAYYRLFMLNLQGIISSSIELERIFIDLHQKYKGDYVYGMSYITESALHVIDTLDMVIFYLNAASGGGDIDLYDKLDNLKKKINSFFGDGEPGNMAAHPVERTPGRGDPVSPLYRNIMDYTVRVSLSEGDLRSEMFDESETAHDILISCYERIFAVLDSWLRSVAAAVRNKTVPSAYIIGIPTSYLIDSEIMTLEMLVPDRAENDMLHSNPGILRLLDGIYEIQDSSFFASNVQQPDTGTCVRGMTIYSNETLALYHVPGKSKNIVVANVCDDVGSNYIKLLIGSAGGHALSPSSWQLVRKLLDWLDFRTVSGYGFVTASIRNITLGDMENHLNTLGKLLSFVSSAGNTPLDDESVQRNIDVFLERIV